MRIVAAAVKFKGAVSVLPPPARHHTIMQAIAQKIPESEWPVAGPDDQGFLASDGTFRCREQSFYIALDAGQILPERKDEALRARYLFSEDLW